MSLYNTTHPSLSNTHYLMKHPIVQLRVLNFLYKTRNLPAMHKSVFKPRAVGNTFRTASHEKKTPLKLPPVRALPLSSATSTLRTGPVPETDNLDNAPFLYPGTSPEWALMAA